MNLGGRRFVVDKANGKIAGVCAGIGEHVGVDPTIVRIGFVLAALAGHMWWVTIVAYFVLATVGQPRGASRRAPARATPRREETKSELRDIDLRMQAIETYVASSNSKLAREIEELR